MTHLPTANTLDCLTSYYLSPERKVIAAWKIRGGVKAVSGREPGADDCLREAPRTRAVVPVPVREVIVKRLAHALVDAWRCEHDEPGADGGEAASVVRITSGADRYQE